MFRLSEISKENVRNCFSTEYILIDNFLDKQFLESSHTSFLKDNLDMNLEQKEVITINGHPILDELRKEETSLLKLINTVWDEQCTRLRVIVNLMTHKHVLPIHEDSFWKNTPVRGILYLNGVYGTRFYNNEHGEKSEELGGIPGQLLLFKVQDQGWHSAGLDKNTIKDRFVVSLVFEK